MMTEEAKRLCEPILSVFAAEDGGLSYARFVHSFLPNLLEQERSGNESAKAAVKVIRQFSRLSDALYNGRI